MSIYRQLAVFPFSKYTFLFSQFFPFFFSSRLGKKTVRDPFLFATFCTIFGV